MMQLSGSIRGFFEVFEIVRLHDSVNCKDIEFQLDNILSIEPFIADLRIFKLFLEVNSEVLVLMTPEVRLGSV